MRGRSRVIGFQKVDSATKPSRARRGDQPGHLQAQRIRPRNRDGGGVEQMVAIVERQRHGAVAAGLGHEAGALEVCAVLHLREDRDHAEIGEVSRAMSRRIAGRRGSLPASTRFTLDLKMFSIRGRAGRPWP